MAQEPRYCNINPLNIVIIHCGNKRLRPSFTEITYIRLYFLSSNNTLQTHCNQVNDVDVVLLANIFRIYITYLM